MRTSQTRRSTDAQLGKARRWRFSEHDLKAAVASTLWVATLLGVFVASHVPQLAPEDVDFWRVVLGTLGSVMCLLTVVLSRTISHAAFQLFIEFSIIPALVANVILLQITPATEAVLFNLIFTLIYASYYLRRTALLLTLIGFILVALSTLFTDPASQTPYLKSFLVVYIATILVTVSLMYIQNAERVKALANLRERGLTDPLTHLANLRQLQRTAEQMLSKQELKKHPDEIVGLLLVDLDNFKSANSRYGHVGGDYALRAIADQMARVSGEEDVVARIGGDEFAVLLRADSPARLEERAEIFRGAVRAGSSNIDLPEIEIDASVGVAIHPVDGRDLDELLGVADQRLYEKKGAKRHPVPNLEQQQIVSESPPAWLAEGLQEPEQDLSDGVEKVLDRITGGKYPLLATRTIYTRTASLGWLIGCTILAVSLMVSDAYPDSLLTWWMVMIVGISPIPVLMQINASPGGVWHVLYDFGAFCSILVGIWATGGINSAVASLLVLHVANQAWFWGTRGLSIRLLIPVLVAASPLAYTSLSASQADVVEVARIYSTCILLFTLVLAMHINRVLLGRLHRVAEKLATHDPLTGVSNRRAFNLYVTEQIADPEVDQFAIVMIDLDNFKRVNTEHGHQAGDRMLTALAQSLATVARADDCIARIGGDEFAAVLPGVGVDGARTLAERLVGAVAETPGAADFGIGASAGFALWPLHGDSLDQLVFTADGALMAVKATGKGSARVARIVSAVR